VTALDQLDQAELERIIAKQSPADAVVLRKALGERPWQIARRRLAMRAEALEAAAVLLPEAPLTVCAKDLARRLARCANGDWKRQPRITIPRDPLTAALHRVLQINGGRPIGWRTIYDALQNSPLAAATDQRDGGDRGDADAGPSEADPAARTAAARAGNAEV
jgi:hypothetical protein